MFTVNGLGCMPPICKSMEKNEILGCEGNICGTFDGLRYGSLL